MKALFVTVLAFLFFMHQNQYFGWNKQPQSDTELIADGITYLLIALAFLAGKWGQYDRAIWTTHPDRRSDDVPTGAHRRAARYPPTTAIRQRTACECSNAQQNPSATHGETTQAGRRS